MKSLDAERDNQRGKTLWESGQREQAMLAWRQALASAPDSVAALTSLAWALAQQGPTEEATRLAQRAVEISAADPAVRRVLGEVLFLQGQYQEAIGHYQVGVRENQGGSVLLSACLHRDLGDAYYMIGEFQQAAEAYQRALALGSDEAYCRLWLGWASQQLSDRGRARHEFERACELAPEWHEALYAAGQIHSAQGDCRRARHYLERALQHYPEEDEEGRAAAACELGNALRGLGEVPEAIRSYRHALSLDPTHPVARFNLGLAYGELGDHEAAIAAFEVAGQLDPSDSDIWIERGRACLELGRHHEALEAYQAAQRICPDSAEACSGLGLAYYGLGLYETSAEHYRSGARLAPGDPWVHYNLGLALEAAGQPVEAEHAMAEAWELGQQDCELCLGLARALTSQGRDLVGAARAARRACGLDPENAEAHDALAMALYWGGDYDAALGPAQQAVRLLPEAAEFRYNLGLIQESRRDLASARASFARALQLSPGFEEAQEALQRLEDVA